MGLIKIDLESLRISAPVRQNIVPVYEKFIQDMDHDKSHFFHLPVQSKWNEEYTALQATLASRIPEVDTFIQLGIGGSSLGAELIVRALGSNKAPQFHFFENIDPDWIFDTLEKINPKRTLFYVCAKSGNTLETLAQLIYIIKHFEKTIEINKLKNHFVFCTHPEQTRNGSLRELAKQWNIPTFEIPTNLGGRYSALSAVGLFPALVAGVNPAELLKGASDYRNSILNDMTSGKIHESLMLAYSLVHFGEHLKAPMTVLMPYSQKLRKLSDWFTQLWAESLGKNGKGLTPIPAMGATDQHSILQLLRDGPKDKAVGFVEVQGFKNILELKWSGSQMGTFELLNGITMNQLMDAELNATRQVLSKQEKPHFTVSLSRLNAHNLGQLIFMFEFVTAFSGYLMGIDPFDQPGVEEGKVLTHERIIAAKRNMQ